jgi:hypothetical protein
MVALLVIFLLCVDAMRGKPTLLMTFGFQFILFFMVRNGRSIS